MYTWGVVCVCVCVFMYTHSLAGQPCSNASCQPLPLLWNGMWSARLVRTVGETFAVWCKGNLHETQRTFLVSGNAMRIKNH